MLDSWVSKILILSMKHNRFCLQQILVKGKQHLQAPEKKLSWWVIYMYLPYKMVMTYLEMLLFWWLIMKFKVILVTHMLTSRPFYAPEGTSVDQQYPGVNHFEFHSWQETIVHLLWQCSWVITGHCDVFVYSEAVPMEIEHSCKSCWRVSSSTHF